MLGGSGTVSEVAPVEAAGVITLVVANAALTGNCGALTGARVYSTVFGSELHAARSNVASAIAPVRFNRRIRKIDFLRLANKPRRDKYMWMYRQSSSAESPAVNVTSW